MNNDEEKFKYYTDGRDYDLYKEFIMLKNLMIYTPPEYGYFRNEVVIDIDSKCFKYEWGSSGEISQDGRQLLKRIVIGYIELEYTGKNSKWQDELPDNWRYSFLERKVKVWDDEKGKFLEEPKVSGDVYYIKFSNNLSNCYGAFMSDIFTFDEEIGNEMDNPYNNSYLRTDQSNKKVDYGIQNCINKYLTKWDKEFKDKLNG